MRPGGRKKGQKRGSSSGIVCRRAWLSVDIGHMDETSLRRCGMIVQACLRGPRADLCRCGDARDVRGRGLDPRQLCARTSL